MIIVVDKEDPTNSLSNLSNTSSTQTAGRTLIGPAPPPIHKRSHNSVRAPDHTPERWHPQSSPPRHRGTVNNPPPRATGGSRLYADYLKEIREAQKKVDQLGMRVRDNEEQFSSLGSVATAVSVRAVSARGVGRRAGGTF